MGNSPAKYSTVKCELGSHVLISCLFADCFLRFSFDVADARKRRLFVLRFVSETGRGRERESNSQPSLGGDGDEGSLFKAV